MAQDAASRYRGAYGSSAASAGPNTMNNFQFTQMGLNAGLATKNPYVAAIGTVGGFFGDLSLGRKRKLEADRNLMNSISQDAYNAQVAANPNPYTQDGGYQQAMSFSRGGTVRRFYKDGGPVGHVIPAERAGQAVVDAAKAGIDLQKPASRTGNQEGIIPGAGHPKADDRIMTPDGQPIRVSSGEVYVNRETMEDMARAVGMGIGAYARMMHPDTKHGDGFADGGPVDPPKRIIQPPPENPVERVFLKSVGVKLTPRIGQRKKSIVSREKLDRMEPRSSQDGGARVPVSVPVPEPLPTDDSRYEPLRHSQAYGGSNITYPFDPIVAYSRKGERLPLEEKDYIFDTDEQKDWQTKKIKKYAQGGPVDPPREKTRTGISTERMRASDALAEQFEQERQARGRFRVEMPHYSSRFTIDGHSQVGVETPARIAHPRGHDGKTQKNKRVNYIGVLQAGPPTDMRKHPGAFDARRVYADGGPVLGDPEKRPLTPGDTSWNVFGSYAKMMYPDTQHGDRFANGGPVSGNPPTTLERERLPFTPYALDTGDPYGLGVDVPHRLGPDLKPANGPREASLGLMKSKPVSFGGGSALPEPSARLKSAPMSGTTKSAPATASDGTGGMRKTNNIAFATNLALGTASLIYNAAQKGPVIPKPPAYEPEKVDLKTTALKAELDRRRTSGVATAGYALSNKQGLGRDLGLRSMDLSQRSQDALAVETVENQERSANTQIENQARLYNNQSLQRWMERDQEAQMNFRREKGDRMSMSLAGISDATSGWASGNQQIGAMGQMNDFNDRYLRYLSGNSETMQWDGSTIYFGDGTSTKRVERGVKLYDPQDYKYISNRFIR